MGMDGDVAGHGHGDGNNNDGNGAMSVATDISDSHNTANFVIHRTYQLLSNS